MAEVGYRYDAIRDRRALDIRAHPNTWRSEIAGIHGNHAKIRVAAPSVADGANGLPLDFLKKTLELPSGQVMIGRGNPGRTQIIDIAHPGAAVLERVKRLCQP
jgi:uncharacterized protein YggU (UPF0235/DUF167 family)